MHNRGMTKSVLIAGGGMAGLATGLAMARAGWAAQVFERAPVFAEVGAGVQLGPNVTHILKSWGLAPALREVAAFPAALHSRCMRTGRVLASWPLHDAAARYGAPYATVHRADLQQLLLQAAQREGVAVHTDAQVLGVQPLGKHTPQTLGTIETSEGASLSVMQQGRLREHSAPLVVVADGLWSPLRQQLLGDGLPRSTGHVAYRALVLQADLPPHLRSQDIHVWMGPQSHLVSYPVRGGEALNVVFLSEGSLRGAREEDSATMPTWSAEKPPEQLQAELQRALRGADASVIELMGACRDWRLWPLCDRPPMRGPHEHGQGRVVLLGDAAHPMLPYLAQGTGMALEDAAELALQLGQGRGANMGTPRPTTSSGSSADAIDQALQRFAKARWQRNARVQARAVRNGHIFHASGPLRWGRDLGLRLLGPRLMDMPWLYGYRTANLG